MKVPAGAIWDSNNTKRLKLGLKYRLGLATLDSAFQDLTILGKFFYSHHGFNI